ncbi:MAG TPA: hypothetical protein VNF72_18735, partial [Myxococcota bacterium]|nr:hypothetical protein [Myxococcota bacterium]
MRAFSGPLEPQEVEKPHAIEAACSRLATVAAIGLLEDLPGFVDDFRQRFRVRLRLPHATAGTLRQRAEREELTDALRVAHSRSAWRRTRRSTTSRGARSLGDATSEGAPQ